MKTSSGSNHGSPLTYAVGFVLSVGLTLLAYFLVARHVLPPTGAIPLIIGLAALQLLVQLVFFLHLDRGSARTQQLPALCFAILVVFILVAGSLWIMRNLDYNMRSGDDLTNYIFQQEAIPK